jgi:3-keto-disaccharide hydrolase
MPNIGYTNAEMKQLCIAVIAAIALLTPALAQKRPPFAGRWDLTITTAKDTYPSWMEFTEKNGKPEVRIVGRVASVHPATKVKLEGSHLSFTTSEWFGGEIPVEWDIHVAGGRLSGTQKRSDGVEGRLTGVPAPALRHKTPAAWTKPEPLFDGKDLNGWQPDNPAKNHWVAEDGDLVNQAAGANIRTTRKFGDFKLHIEYNCPPEGNSGVYLRGRYEVQVEYEKPGVDDQFHSLGSIYGFLAPAVELPRQPGQWESFDVILVGRNVTVVRDGKTIIAHREIPGITGGAIDSHEGEPGPIYIQGDHTGGMKYRNITIAVPQR